MISLRLAAALAGVVIWKSLPARTASVEGPNPIAELMSAEIGGMTQWLLIRGADREAPILLWLHGGPGAAQMPIHSITAGLERDFVVVHWDQRGAGKSNPRNLDPDTMTLGQYLADAREVTKLLRDRVGDEPLIVLGFEKAGFRKASDTASVVGGFPRVLMRLEFPWVVGTRVLSPGFGPSGAGRLGTG